MLEKLFLHVLNMSFIGSFVIIFILIARIILKKVPKIFSYSLWAVALFRLIFPFSFESILSLIPVNQVSISENILYSQTPQINTAVEGIDNFVNSSLPVGTVYGSVNPIQIFIFIVSLLWVTGIFILLTYTLISLFRLKDKLKKAVHERDNIFIASNIETAFVLGIINPKIYLPTLLSAAEKEYIILHEQIHIKRFDHLIRIISFLALCIHWFNPLVWLAFYTSGKDMEMSCDESVLKNLGADVKKKYSSSLLSLTIGRSNLGGIPLAFGEGNTKDRIKNVLNYKKPDFWVIVIAVIACVLVAVSLMTSPKTSQIIIDNPNIINDIDVAELMKQKTDYVGDNSKVGAIISLLPLSQNLNYNGAELSTSEPPYEVTVNIKTDTETRNFYTGELNKYSFQVNAAIMFSLIGNVEYVNFSISDGITEPYIIQYTRQWADELFDKNISEFSSSQIELINLIDNLYDRSRDAAISKAIFEYNGNGNESNADFITESHVILGTEGSGSADSDIVDTVTEYMMVNYSEIKYLDDWFTESSGSNMPVAITFYVNERGEYTLKEYWVPMDGGGYLSSIKEKFPQGLYESAIDTQKYIQAQIINCYDKAIQYGELTDIDVENRIEYLLEIITSSPLESSNPKAYIDEHPIEYRELIYIGQYTLKYCFSEFEKGNQQGLRGHIMASACRDLMEIFSDSFEGEGLFNTGQDWYNAFKKNTINLSSKYDDRVLKEKHYVSWLLFQRISK